MGVQTDDVRLLVNKLLSLGSTETIVIGQQFVSQSDGGYGSVKRPVDIGWRMSMACAVKRILSLVVVEGSEACRAL